MAKQFKVPVNLVQLAADPSTATPGDIYFNSALSKIKFYSGAAWLEVGSGAGGGGTTNHTHDYNGNVIVGAGGAVVTTATFLAGVPNNANGQNGDVYVDITNLNVYAKSEGSWGSPTEINVYTKTEIDGLLNDLDNSLGDYVPLTSVGFADGVARLNPDGHLLIPTSPAGAGVKFADNTIQTTAFDSSNFATSSALSDLEALVLAGI